ncbi:MAG: hydroxyacid dehydrogenase [Planctomycetes bacterium]|nr:hydroxyacid dehydrogenase [Planctomycetota bacterium]
MSSTRRVLACMAPEEFGWFLEPAMGGWDASIELVRCEAKPGIDHLIAKLNETGAAVLLTAWSTPKLPADIRSRAPSLRYLCHACGTIRGIVPREAIVDGLLVSNWGSVISRTVAEHTLVHILCCLRRMTEQQLAMHVDRRWSIDVGEKERSLFERRVGMHGFGNVARELVKLLAPFGCSISAFGPFDPDEAFTSRGVSRCTTVEDLYAGSEIIACVAPLTPETRGTVTERLLRLIPEGGAFVNTGRGAVVDEGGLAKVAKEGRLQFGLDVFEKEPLPKESPLRGLPNVSLTAHCAGPTPDRRQDCGRYAIVNIGAFFAGRKVESVIDATRYDLQT